MDLNFSLCKIIMYWLYSLIIYTTTKSITISRYSFQNIILTKKFIEPVPVFWFDFTKVRLVLFFQPFGMKFGIATQVFLILAINLLTKMIYKIILKTLVIQQFQIFCHTLWMFLCAFLCHSWLISKKNLQWYLKAFSQWNFLSCENNLRHETKVKTIKDW